VRLKKLACSGAVFGMAAGMLIAASGIASASTDTIYPYLDWSLGSNTGATTQIGSTDPGQADAKLCVTFPAKGATGQTPITVSSDAGHYSGRVNQVVTNPATQLDQLIVLQDLLTATPACTATGIAITATETPGVPDNVKHKGSLAVTQAADVQSGLLASSFTNIRVHYTAGQVISLPGGATVQGGALSGGSFVDLRLKAVTVKTKASLNLTACNDVDHVVTLANTDSTTVERSVTFDNSDADHSYAPANAATKNLITLRQCAENTANVPGKPITTTIKIAGAGTTSADLLYAQTTNPQLWDTARGTSCKDTNTNERVFFCKGDYGLQIPFVLSVRGIDSGNASIDPKGLLHASAPLALSGGSEVIS